MLKLTPREKVQDLYLKYPQPRTFWQDLSFYRAVGVVMDTKHLFLMAKPVLMGAPEEAIRAPWVSFKECDAWFIFAFAGDIRQMLTAAPYPLPWVGWSRRLAPIKWYRASYALGKIASRGRVQGRV